MLFINLCSMKSKSESFEQTMRSFGYRYSLPTVFDDFLTMVLCSFSRKPGTGVSYHEDLYLATIGKYKTDELPRPFPHLLAILVLEMEERKGSDSGNDVLGECYELHLSQSHKAQHFTPWPVCVFMAKSITLEKRPKQDTLRILDPCCGSGRMLLAAAKELGPQYEYYGIDIDPVCIRMTAINLFLNGLFHAEVMCADALVPSDFRMSYVTSLFPFGVFRMDDKEDSPLWHMQQSALRPASASAAQSTQADSPSTEVQSDAKPAQLKLF